jgi:hypothetical protein
MKIETHSHRDGHRALALHNRPVLAFVGMLVGTAETEGDLFEVAARWSRFLLDHGWKECRPPLQTSAFIKDQFLWHERACVNLSLVHGDQVGHVLLAFQGLFAHRDIDVGVLCVGGRETFNRVKADLSWLQDTVTVPIWVVSVIPFTGTGIDRPARVLSGAAS